MRPVLLIVLLLLAGSAAAPPAHAWGDQGHRIVAKIAEHRLRPAALAQIRELLGPQGIATLTEIAPWADRVAQTQPETAAWHWVNIPLEATRYDAARDCPGGACTVAQVARFHAILANQEAEPRQRAEALGFLVHLVGDLHEPMNCVGARRTPVRFFGRATQLHEVWESGMLARLGTPERTEARLAESITPDELRDWATGLPEDWVAECHAVAREVAYGRLPADAEPEPVIGQVYQQAATPALERQLKRAGVRLAALLNGALAPPKLRPWFDLTPGPPPSER